MVGVSVFDLRCMSVVLNDFSQTSSFEKLPAMYKHTMTEHNRVHCEVDNFSVHYNVGSLILSDLQ